jgi:hypothetical protein
MVGEGRDPDYHAPVIGYTSDPYIHCPTKSSMADMITQGGPFLSDTFTVFKKKYGPFFQDFITMSNLFYVLFFSDAVCLL